MLRLVELHVRKYRDLVDGGPLRFGPGPVFLLGPNGSGKTTLLELIALLLMDDLRPLFEEREPVEMSWILETDSEPGQPPVYLRQILSISEPAAPAAQYNETELGQLNEREWNNHIQFSSSEDGCDGPAIELRHDASPKFNPEMSFDTLNQWPDRTSEFGYLQHLSIYMQRATPDDAIATRRIMEIAKWMRSFIRVFVSIQRFSEALEPFQYIVGGQPDQKSAWAQSIENGTPDHPAQPFGVPRWPLTLIRWDLTVPISDLNTNNDPLYRLLLQLLGAESIELHPKLVSDNGRGRRIWRGFDVYVHWDGGAIHHHSQLSFGQKRLLAMFWHLGYSAPVPLLTDELTNGLHAGWVRAIIDHIGPRQGFHAVQNPLLLDRYGPGENPEEIAGRFVICTVEPGERGRQWRWRSPTTVECERLWAAYNAGFQHLSELLVSEGLW